MAKQLCRSISVTWPHLRDRSEPLFPIHVFHRWSDRQNSVAPSLPGVWSQQNFSRWLECFKANVQCNNVQELSNKITRIDKILTSQLAMKTPSMPSSHLYVDIDYRAKQKNATAFMISQLHWLGRSFLKFFTYTIITANNLLVKHSINIYWIEGN